MDVRPKGHKRRLLLFLGICLCVYAVWSSLTDSAVTSRWWPPSHQDDSPGCRINAESEVKNQPALDAHIQGFGVSAGNDHVPKLSVGSINISEVYKNKWVGFPDLAGVDCKKAFDPKTSKNSLYPMTARRVLPRQYINDCQDCTPCIAKYGFNRHPPVSHEERDFPIAFTILFYKDIDQALFLLRAIYRPHNVYCLSVDTKSSIELLEAVRSVTRCLPNVFVSSKLEHIVYAGFTRLMADIDCMEDLIRHPVDWKYVINLPGQQFPLRTNLELVRILQLYNGSNDVEGLLGKRMLHPRYKYKHKYVENNSTGEVSLVRTNEKHKPPPHGLEVVKGSAYGTFSRKFVEFVVNSKVARDLLEWAKWVASPDEYYWAILHHSKVVPVPGAYTAGAPDQKRWISTYASWSGSEPCATIHTRGVCIFTPEDLPRMMEKHELFANKFYITHHPASLHCLDEMLVNLTFTGQTRDLSFYATLPFVIKSNSTGG